MCYLQSSEKSLLLYKYETNIVICGIELLIMANKKYLSVGLKVLLWLFFALCFFVLVSFPLYVGLEYGKLPSVTEYWIQYISVFLSSFSFAAVLLTLWLQQREEKKQQKQIEMNFDFAQHNYDSQILEKIHFFTSESMHESRTGACLLWAKLESEDSMRQTIHEYFKMSLTNDWGDEKTAKSIYEGNLYKYFGDFFKLIRYFNVLSFYSFNNLTANAIHYYYIYYRPFFLKMIDIDNGACDLLDEQREKPITRENWIHLIEKFDEIMIANNLSIE